MQTNWFGTSFSTTTLIVLFILELAGLSWYTWRDVQSQLEPRNLVDRAEESIRANYPEIRKRIKQDVETHADEIADQVTQQVLQSSPKMRGWLEQVTARQLAYALDEVSEFSAEQFRVFVQNNREQVTSALVQLEEAPEESRELIEDLEAQLEEVIGADLKSQSRDVLKLHRQLNDKLERLSSDAPLDPKELLERRMVRILRTLAQERLPDLSLEGPAD